MIRNLTLLLPTELIILLMLEVVCLAIYDSDVDDMHQEFRQQQTGKSASGELPMAFPSSGMNPDSTVGETNHDFLGDLVTTKENSTLDRSEIESLGNEYANSEYVEQLDSVFATMIQKAMIMEHDIETTSQKSLELGSESGTEKIVLKRTVERTASMDNTTEVDTYSSFESTNTEGLDTNSAPNIESMTAESTSSETKRTSFATVMQGNNKLEPSSTIESISLENVESESGTKDARNNQESLTFQSQPTTPESTVYSSTTVHDLSAESSTLEKTPFSPVELPDTSWKQGRSLRLIRKQPEIRKMKYFIESTDTKFEKKEWNTSTRVGSQTKSEITTQKLTFNLKSQINVQEIRLDPFTVIPDTTTPKPTVEPRKACARKSVTCPECKAISKYCHYNFTGKFCFFWKISHENDVYECGIRFVAIDSYFPVIMTVVAVVVVSVAAAVYAVHTILEQKRNAALPQDEMDDLREQVQFVRDRRTNK